MDPDAQRAMIDRIGGEGPVQLLVNRFYDLIETLPQGAAILAMHQRGHGVAHARAEQVNFLCGFLGGRRTYHERHGHMNLREIHAHLEIHRTDAEDWLAVMDRAMTETGVADQPRGEIMATLRRAALMLAGTGGQAGQSPS